MKTIVLTLTVFLFSYSAFAISYGGSAEINSKLYKNTDKELEKYGEGTLSAHCKIPFSKDNLAYLSMEGFVSEILSDYANNGFENSQKLDLTLFKFSDTIRLNRTDTVVLSLGRFMIADITGIILGQTNDGLMVQYLSQRLNASAYGGWTGLINAQSVTVIDCMKSDFTYDTDSPYDFASSYGIFEGSLSLPYILFNQTISAETIALVGTNGFNSDNSGYYRLYTTAGINGPLGKVLFYTLAGSLCFDKDADPGVLAKFKADWYPAYKSENISLCFVYASGNEGPFSPFKGITSASATDSYFESEYSAIIKAGISASIKPVKNLLFYAGTDCIYSAPKSNFSYSGVQFNTRLHYQPFTDVSIKAGFTQYTGINKEDNKTKLNLSSVISF